MMRHFLKLVLAVLVSVLHVHEPKPTVSHVPDPFICGQDTLMCSGTTQVCVSCPPGGCTCGLLNRKPCYGTICECGLTYKADIDHCVR